MWYVFLSGSIGEEKGGSEMWRKKHFHLAIICVKYLSILLFTLLAGVGRESVLDGFSRFRVISQLSLMTGIKFLRCTSREPNN